MPLGVNADPGKHPELRDSLVRRLRVAGKMAADAGVTHLPALPRHVRMRAVSDRLSREDGMASLLRGLALAAAVVILLPPALRR